MPSPIEWGIGVVVILILVLSIATASIGKECYNENKTWGEDAKRKANSNYLTVGIWAPIVAMFAVAGGLAYAQMTGQTKNNAVNAVNPVNPADAAVSDAISNAVNPVNPADAAKRAPPPIPIRTANINDVATNGLFVDPNVDPEGYYY